MWEGGKRMPYLMKCGHIATTTDEIGEPVCLQCVGTTLSAYQVDRCLTNYDEIGDVIKMHYWYFNYKLKVPDTGYEKADEACAQSVSGVFPMKEVFAMFKEKYGDRCKIVITMVTEISVSSYEYLVKDVLCVDE